MFESNVPGSKELSKYVASRSDRVLEINSSLLHAGTMYQLELRLQNQFGGSSVLFHEFEVDDSLESFPTVLPFLE